LTDFFFSLCEIGRKTVSLQPEKPDDMRQLLIFAMMLVATAANAQKPIEMNLWPDGPRTNNGDPEDQAKIWVYLPDSKKATGRAVVCCPGGGYQHLHAEYPPAFGS
jgi:acetyl esterase/lipase